MNDSELQLLRLAIDVARRAREHGNHPFGALLTDEQGNVLLESAPAQPGTAYAPLATTHNTNESTTPIVTGTCNICAGGTPAPPDQELAYIDQVRLIAVDHPAGVEIRLESPPAPEEATRFIQEIGKASRDSSRVEVPFERDHAFGVFHVSG